MLTFIGKVYKTSIDDDLIEAYYATLRKFDYNILIKTGYRLLESCTYFPKPKEFLDELPQRENNGDSKNDQYLIQRFTCSMCGDKVSALSEGMCLDCAQVNPFIQPKQKEWTPPAKDDFKMESRHKCPECGKIDICIKEPASSGTWKCRDCYSGMTLQERQAKIHQIITGIGNAKGNISKEREAH